jgi:hypothetical protein
MAGYFKSYSVKQSQKVFTSNGTDSTNDNTENIKTKCLA